MGNEIITLQFGNFSNYIGTHFWNIEKSSFMKKKEESLTNIFFRDSINTYEDKKCIPRAIIVENQKDFIVSNRKNKLKNTLETKKFLRFVWGEKVKWIKHRTLTNNRLQQSEKECLHLQKFKPYIIPYIKCQKEKLISFSQVQTKKNPLKENVDHWSDFSQVQFHHRTLHPVQFKDEYAHPFDTFQYGMELFNTFEQREIWIDKVRFFTEECDNLQGFQILADNSDAFGGIQCQCLDLLHDEYESKSSILFSVTPQMSNSVKDPVLSHQLKLNQLLVQNKSWNLTNALVPINVNNWDNKKYENIIDQDEFISSAFIGGTLQTICAFYSCKDDTNIKSCLRSLILKPSLKQILLTSNFSFESNYDKCFQKNEKRSKSGFHQSLSYSEFMSNISFQLNQPDIKSNSIRMISEWGVLRSTNIELKEKFEKFMEQGYPCFLRKSIHVPSEMVIPFFFPFKLSKKVNSCATFYTDREQFMKFNRDLKSFKYLTKNFTNSRSQKQILEQEQEQIIEHLSLVRDAYEQF